MSDPEFTLAEIEDLPSIRRVLERLIAVRGGNPNSFALWRSSWEHGMSVCGWPNAMLYHVAQADPRDENQRQVSYGWEIDTDAWIHGWLENEHVHPGQDGWDDAHVVFVTVDIVRPTYIMPSIALERLLRKEQTENN